MLKIVGYDSFIMLQDSYTKEQKNTETAVEKKPGKT